MVNIVQGQKKKKKKRITETKKEQNPEITRDQKG